MEKKNFKVKKDYVTPKMEILNMECSPNFLHRLVVRR